MHSPHLAFHTQALDFWLARAAIALIAGLQLLFVNNDLIFGPRWLAPLLELAMLVPLSVATVWTQGKARTAHEKHWHVICQHRKAIRGFALLLTAIVMMLNFYALISVTRELLGGAKAGQSLLLDALNIWFTNIVVFALWFWNIDRGGPARSGLLGSDARPDFLFPQMIGAGDKDPSWTPGFVDYFYVSFTNATAFSPTDTMPLSAQSKLLMAAEATISLLTVGLVAARAVNILT